MVTDAEMNELPLHVRLLAIGVLALLVAIVGYAIGSFLLARGHTPARRLGVALRELVREAVLAILTQPLLPLYYFVGRRMDRLFVPRAREAFARSGSVPVVFVHGYMQNRVGFVGLARAFARRGLGPLYGFNYPWFGTLVANARRLERFIERVCEETNSAAVDLVCHSMGGLVAMEMMRDEARRDTLKVRRCVTIATPHAGVVWRGPLLGIGATSLRAGSKLLELHAGATVAVPTLSVFSSHDNIVFPKETSRLGKRGGRDLEIEHVGHLSILFSPRVADAVASFLAEPGPSPAIVGADVRAVAEPGDGVRVGVAGEPGGGDPRSGGDGSGEERDGAGRAAERGRSA
jgi:pimeloyl-ACP methyl ester carboxylesterase